MSQEYQREQDHRFKLVSCGEFLDGPNEGKHFCHYEYSDGHTETVINSPAWQAAQKDFKEYMRYLASAKEAKK